jgi:hypothetical protein
MDQVYGGCIKSKIENREKQLNQEKKKKQGPETLYKRRTAGV